MTRRNVCGRSDLVNKSVASALGLALFAAAGVQAMAGELPKKGTFAATFVHEAKAKAIELGKDQWGWTVFGRIATMSNSGDGLWHNMSGDCLGMGVGDQGSGYCRHADSDGDMIFERWEEPVIGKGTGTLLGGTGKFAGIEAKFEYEYVLLPSPEGTQHLAGKKRGSYKLP